MITKLKVFWPGRFAQYQAVIGLQTQKQIGENRIKQYEGCALNKCQISNRSCFTVEFPAFQAKKQPESSPKNQCKVTVATFD